MENNIISTLGKIPPQVVDIEEAVLGALLMDSEAFFRIGDLLKPEMFYKNTHQLVFTAIKHFEGVGCSIHTVSEQLKTTGFLDIIGGPFALTQLSNKVASSSHIEIHADYIVRTYKSRECIRISSLITEAAFDGDVDLVSKLDNDLNDAINGNSRKESKCISEHTGHAVSQIVKMSNSETEMIGIPTKLKVLDRFLYGLQAPDLIVLAARPSMGKTALAVTIGNNVSKDYPVMIFSLEMSSMQLTTRLISSESRVPSWKFKVGKSLSPDELRMIYEAEKRLNERPLYIDDTAALSISEFKTKARRAKKLYGIALIIVDYLQLMAGTDSRNRDNEIGQVSRGLKAVAKELDIPVIALSQLNRNVENRAGRRPNLSDLRESGSIEADADIVAFIHRPERYGIMEFEDGSSTKGIAEIIIEKNRNGAVGDLVMRFLDSITLFEDMELDDIVAGNNIGQRNLFEKTDTEDDRPF